MKKNILLILLLLSISNIFGSNNVDSLFSYSNDLYSANKFEEAVDSYLSILDQNISNGIIYYNVGNCYYKLNNLGYARLYYEKAKLYNPTDRDVLHNIKLVKAQLIDDIQSVPDFFLIKIINAINIKFSPSQWGYITILVLYFILFLCLVLFFSKSVESRIASLRVLFFSVPIFIVILFFLIYSNMDKKYNDAVLVLPNTYVKTAPSIDADDYFIIHEGVKFELIDKIDDWSRILLSDGKDGWVKNSYFEVVQE